MRLKKIQFFLVPIILFFVLNLLVNLSLKKIIRDPDFLVYSRVLLSLIFFSLQLKIIKMLSYRCDVNISLGKLSMLPRGIALGLALSLTSFYLFFYINSNLFFESKVNFTSYWSYIIKAISPALSEELVFRHVIVGGLFALKGRAVAIFFGSVPFGIVHMINIFPW